MSDSKAIAAMEEHSPGACPRCGAPRVLERRVAELEAELREAIDSSHRFAIDAYLLAELCREAIARLDELHAESARDLAKRLERILSEDAP